ncbi:uncharacterized protein LOC126248125 [Schistocerca nitens]|uniref:uncharacterized protein LOC126248125 n=1 Tax=Schistocerca nitens TaxID=7011 RepID=UPI002117A15D|nr:uncharacterized protein LOC126248125 [Schistocerca nitens]
MPEKGKMADDEYGYEHRDPRLLQSIESSQTLPQDGDGDASANANADSGSVRSDADADATDGLSASGQRLSLSSSTGSTGAGPDDDDRRSSFGSDLGAATQKQQQERKARPTPPAPSQRSRKKMSAAASDADDATVKEEDLPQKFQVKYLGFRDASGLWGIKHTRKPVDALVAAAKSLKQGTVLPIVNVTVSIDGLTITADKKHDDVIGFFPVDTISYGVQDLVYTRVFSMIVVRDVTDSKSQHPFECHAFVCDSRFGARKITYALAAAFQAYSRSAKGQGKVPQKRFAIDLRVPEQIVEVDQEMPDSEA